MSDFREPMDCSLSGSSVHATFQAKVLEWGAIAFSAPELQCGSILNCSKRKKAVMWFIEKMYVLDKLFQSLVTKLSGVSSMLMNQ